MKASRRKVRYAVVGLGYIAQAAVLPAFAHAGRNSTLAALVSGDRTKLRRLARRYGVLQTAGYEQADDLFRSGGVDAVYVAMPNSLHREWTVRAARAGLHVLCEKPLAVSARDCETMIDETERAGVRLMVAYRLHFERGNLEAVREATSGRLGDPRIFSALFTMQVEPGNTRLQADLGGGSVWDLGIYCVNAARYLFRDEPIEVYAAAARRTGPRFREVDETTTALLRFPRDRHAAFTCSFGAADASSFELIGTKGSVRLDPAFEWSEGLEGRVKVGGRTRARAYPRRDQFAPELLYFSDCVLSGRRPEPSGREGLADVRVIEAIYRSARSGEPVALEPFARARRPEPSQQIRRPPPPRARLVHASPPSRD